MRFLTSRPGLAVARFSILVIAGYLSQVAELLMTADDRLIFGIPWADARPLFIAATVAGVLYAFEPRVDAFRVAWVVLLTVSAWGRALSLLFIGAPALTRAQEFAAATSWLIVFLGGILAALVLTAGNLLDAVRPG